MPSSAILYAPYCWHPFKVFYHITVWIYASKHFLSSKKIYFCLISFITVSFSQTKTSRKFLFAPIQPVKPLLIYKQSICPHLMYGNTVWSQECKTHFKKIQIVQKIIQIRLQVFVPCNYLGLFMFMVLVLRFASRTAWLP